MPNAANLGKILESTRPQTKTQIKSFLGLTGFYQNFIPRYSAIATPLTDLLRKNCPNKIVWGQAQEQSFLTLKDHLISKPILRLPDISKEFTLRTDASDTALGAVLLQVHDGTLHPVMYASKKLSPREEKYPISEKEAMAIVWGIQRFHKFLYATKFIVETDHKPLTVLKGSTTSNPRLMRWSLGLQPYNFTTKVIKGIDNVGADFFSRHFNKTPQLEG
jgi:hypothetical protein